MKGIRTAVITIALILSYIPALSAAGITQNARIGFISMWGETSNNTCFREGASRLEWPMDMKLVHTAYMVNLSDFVEVELGLRAGPWISSGRPMQDYDWMNEALSRSPRRADHEGVDIYSTSIVDSKAFSYDATMRVFPLNFQYATLGLFFSYQNQEMDFKAYDTNQTGFGSWQDQTTSVFGPISTYAVEYDTYLIGLAWRAQAADFLKLTIYTAYIPYAKASDEDNHIRRLRVSRTECTGTGHMLSLSMQFRLSNKWFVSSTCSKLRISTDGHQKQIWYGNDPASPNYDDTGQVMSGINAEINQDSFHAGISIGCNL